MSVWLQEARAYPNGVVCTPHYLATAAGAAMLADGGNAIDAAFAANFVLVVTMLDVKFREHGVEPGSIGVYVDHIRRYVTAALLQLLYLRSVRLQNLLGQARVACADVATPRVMRAELLPHPAEERPVVGGQETRLVRPVFDDVTLPEQLRNGSGGVDADTCRDGHAVASLDGRDRVELDARRTGNSGLDLVCAGSTGSRSVALGGDDEPSERRQGDGAHATHASDRTAASDSCSGPLGSHVASA